MKRAFESLSLPAAKALMESVLSSGHRFRFTAHGVSMSPFIRDGDRVELERITALKVGDIVAASREEKLLVHRIVAVKNGKVLLKGDHLRNPDGWFEQADLLGKIVAVTHDRKEQPVGVTRLNRTVAALSKQGLLPFALQIYAKIFKKVEKKS